MSEFNKKMPEEFIGNTTQPFKNEKDERLILEKKKNTETKQAKLYVEDHKKVRIASAMSDKKMIDILSEAIDLWVKENNYK